jgi:hypothetical protein
LQQGEILWYFIAMFLFVILLVPAAFIYYRAGTQQDDSFSMNISFLAGIVAGLLVMFFDGILNSLFEDRISSLPVKTLYFFLADSCIPYILGNVMLFSLFMAPVKDRISRIRSQSFGIMTVYLPYVMVKFYNLPDIWPVLFIPAMTLSVLFLLDFYVGRYIAQIRSKPDCIDFVLMVIPVGVILLLADICKALWFFRYPWWIFVPLSLLVVLSAIILRIAKYRK